MQVIATFASTLLIDRAGRKILLTLSASAMFICLSILGAYFYLKTTTDLSPYASVPVISVAVFIILFSIGFGPIPWMMIGELFTSKTKGVAGSTSAAFNWILAFTVTKLFQNMVNSVGLGITFGIFGGICAVGTIFVLILVPETKGRDVEEVQQMLGGSRDRRRVNMDCIQENGVTLTIKK